MKFQTISFYSAEVTIPVPLGFLPVEDENPDATSFFIYRGQLSSSCCHSGTSHPLSTRVTVALQRKRNSDTHLAEVILATYAREEGVQTEQDELRDR